MGEYVREGRGREERGGKTFLLKKEIGIQKIVFQTENGMY